MKFPSKINIAQLPTPIESLKAGFPLLRNRFSRIFIKRDDLTGLVTSGNKGRKLEYLLSDALKHRADTIITYGPNQSNHCRAVAACAPRLGFQTFLLLRGRPPEASYDGNLLLDHLLGAHIRHITPEEYKQADKLMEELARELKAKGKKPYLITEGGSNEVGLWGYVECMAEMKDFIEKERIQKVYLPVGSGGTYAGLLLGKKLYGVEVDVVGIIVCDTVEYFTEKIYNMVRASLERYNVRVHVDRDDIQLVDGYIGKGYGIPYPAEVKAVKALAGHQGILLDLVYGGKAFYGMLEELTRARCAERVIFLATGGIFSLFARSARKLLSRKETQ